MQTALRVLLSGTVRLSLKPLLRPWVSLAVQRRWSDVLGHTCRRPPSMASSMVDMGGMQGLYWRPNSARTDRVVLYLHGGAYILGSPVSHGNLAGQIGHYAGTEVYLPDYRLAPEHPFPAALDDAVAAYRWLLNQGHAAASISIAGDSAGGGLTLATAIAIREAGLPAPAAMVLISPWTDLSLSGASIRSRSARDPVLRQSWLDWGARAYCADRPREHPVCSPLFANLAGLSPILIQVGSEEILLDDSLRLEERVKAAGGRVRLHIFEKMWHDFQAHTGLLDESDAALAEIGEFIRNCGNPQRSL